MMQHTIDASGKVLGRLASEVAVLLRGKNEATFSPAAAGGNRVVVYNVSQLRITGKKLVQKFYRHHSGYHGGLKEERMKDLWKRDPREVFRKAVMGMLPKNRLRAKLIRSLTLYNQKSHDNGENHAKEEK